MIISLQHYHNKKLWQSYDNLSGQSQMALYNILYICIWCDWFYDVQPSDCIAAYFLSFYYYQYIFLLFYGLTAWNKDGLIDWLIEATVRGHFWELRYTGKQTDTLMRLIATLSTIFVSECVDIDSIVSDMDRKFFKVLFSPAHCLHSPLPPVKSNPYGLRSRDHNFQLPVCNSFSRKSFIIRSLVRFK